MEGIKYKIQMTNGSAMLIGVVVVLSLIFLFFAGGAAAGMTLLTIKNRTGELNPSNINFGGTCGGTTVPATTLSLDSYQVPDNGIGKISSEDHLVTTEDPTRTPSNNLGITSWGAKRSNDGIKDHLQVTNFATNCSSGSGYCDPTKQEWTPEEGGGAIGEGNKVGLGNIPAAHEPWIMNARWPTPHPKPGTLVIITAKKTQKSIVAVAGYEWGPSESTGHNTGAQKEVLANLDIVHGDEVTFGFAVNQDLSPGTIYSAECSNTTSITTGDVFIDAGHNSGYSSFAKETNGVSSEGSHNWNVAQIVKNKLEKEGFTVAISKSSSDEDPSLTERVKRANDSGAGLMISIHSNSDGGVGPMGLIFCQHNKIVSGNGKVDYADDNKCSNNTTVQESKELSRSIIGKLNNNFGWDSKKFWGGDLGVLAGLNIPGVIVEMFAHDETSDLNKISGKDDLLAQSIVDGILGVVNKK